MRHLLVSPLDWPGLLEQADRHGIVPLLYHHLQGITDVVIPEAALTELAHRSRKCLVWNLCLHREQVSLLEEFNQAGIPVTPLKGFLLADMLYGDLALRPMCDIDLLVRPEDVAKGEQALLRAGYIRSLPPEHDADLYHYAYTKDCEGGASVIVELHWDLAKSHAARLDVREVWRSGSRGTWEGQEIWTMALPDLFLYLCLHAVKDGLGSLRVLLDIALTIEHFGKILPWEELVGKIRAAQIRMPVYLSLLQSREFLGAQVPVEFLAAIRPARGIGWLLGHALFTWRGGLLHTPTALLEGPMMTLLMFLWEDS
ncbi:MAG: nucleotidyltransferase family protein, partial [Dehalococcoidia bacterium]